MCNAIIVEVFILNIVRMLPVMQIEKKRNCENCENVQMPNVWMQVKYLCILISTVERAKYQSKLDKSV